MRQFGNDSEWLCGREGQWRKSSGSSACWVVEYKGLSTEFCNKENIGDLDKTVVVGEVWAEARLYWIDEQLLKEERKLNCREQNQHHRVLLDPRCLSGECLQIYSVNTGFRKETDDIFKSVS